MVGWLKVIMEVALGLGGVEFCAEEVLELRQRQLPMHVNQSQPSYRHFLMAHCSESMVGRLAGSLSC